MEMNDYRQHVNLNQRFQPPATTSMGRFFSNRLRDSLQLSTMLTSNERENFDQTTADNEATPEPPISVYDLNRSIITPSSTSSKLDSYFTQPTSDTHKFSRRVELSSAYNILKNRTSSRPTRLPATLQGRAPLAQLNPLPATETLIPNETPDENRQRRLSFTDHYRAQYLAYHQQYNADGTRRPFSSDSPLPPSMPGLVPTNHYIGPSPLVHNRTVYEPIEPLKLAPEQEDSSIADLSRELRAAAYPTTRKPTNHSPTRETSPSTTRYSTRQHSKRALARPLPKIHPNEQQTAISNMILPHYYQYHESEKLPSNTDDRLQSSSNNSFLLDQFFNADQTHETIPANTTAKRESSQTSALLMRTSSLPNSTDDTTMSFVSKYARLAPIIPSQSSMTTTSEPNQQDETLDNSSLHTDNFLLTDELLQTSDMIPHPDSTLEEIEENYSYVPTKEQLRTLNGVPLLELDELETSSDMSESQLVPIIYAKELANEIDLLQKAHLLKQQQRSMSMENENDRTIDNNSVPPPANMELLNFEALEEEISTLHHQEDTPLSSPTIPTTMMEISSPPLPLPPPSELATPPSSTEIETSTNNILQHAALVHNRSIPWFKLPTELWFKILHLLSSTDLHHFSYVCKRFSLLARDRACQHQITLHRRMKFEQHWFDVFTHRQPIALSFIQCRQQDLENTEQTDPINWSEFFHSIGSTLLHFTMHGCYHEPFTPNKLLPIVLQTCSNLLSLNLRWNNITSSTLNQLINYPRMTHLQTLDLSGCQSLDDTLLINIFIRTETEFHLEKFILHACTNITWISLDTIGIRLPKLTHLDLSRCIGLKNPSSNEHPTCFQSWPQLQSINFSHLLNLTDQDLILVFEHCKYLHTLILDECLQLTDQTLIHLPKHLRMLSLNNCTNFSTENLMKFNEQCPNLHRIDLQSVRNFNDQCLIHWSEKAFAQLEILVIDDCLEYTSNNLEKFLDQHRHVHRISMRNSRLIEHEKKHLQEKYPQIEFVFH